MKITEFNKEIIEALDEMIQERKDKWEPHRENICELRKNIGKFKASIEFNEKRNSLNADELNNPLRDKLRRAIDVYNSYKEDTKALADTINKEIEILENLKREY